MALSGSLSTTYSGWTYRVDWSASQSIANNTSTVTCRHYLVCASGYDLYISSRSNNRSVLGSDRQTYTSPSISTSGGTTHLLGTTTHTVAHGSTGAASPTLTGEFFINASLAGTYKSSLTVSGTLALDTIPIASQPSLITWPETTNDVGDFGDTISIHMNRQSSAFTHTVRYAFGSLTGTIATGVGTGTTWTIPLSFMDLIPDSTSGSGLIYVDTYNGSTFVGTRYTGFTATVPSSVKPSCSLQVLDATDYKDTYGNLIKGLSKLYVKVNTVLAYSSGIASYNVTANGVKYTAAEITTGVLTAAGTTTITATVTDQRGRTSAAATASFPVIDYHRPNVTSVTVHRCDEDGTEDDQGDHVQVTFTAEITPLNNNNSAAYAVRYKRSEDANYTEVALTDLAGVYEATGEYIFPADADYSYDIVILATDDLYTTERSTSASTAYTFMDWHASGKAIAFGKVSEEEGVFENAMHHRQLGTSYAFQPGSFNGEKGYTALATVTLTELNVNAPIIFEINKRAALCPMRVYVRFASSSSSTDPALDSITYEGDNYGAFLIKTGTSTWQLYVDNTGGWSNPCLQEWYTTYNQMSRLKVTFPAEQLAGTTTSVLTAASVEGIFYRATPAKMESLLDYIYPVGSIYIAYNHIDPATTLGGTWARIENAFLWATTSGGTIGQTGKTTATTGGSGLAYIQVSVWRRTA